MPLLVLCLAAALGPTAANVSAQYFTINDYHSDITVVSDGRTEIVETIRLTFDQPRHGIYRDLPIRYVTDQGDEVTTPLKVRSVTDAGGRDYEYEVSRDGSVARVKIGSAETYVDGEQVYVISYQVERVVAFFRDHDELYWNVTGNDWRAPIEAVSATITIRTDGAVTQPQGACYTGQYGSRETSCDWAVSGNTASFECTRPLEIGEGFTVVFGFDRGLVAPPSAWQQFLWSLNLADNWGLLMPLTALVWMFFRWWRRGRDPRTGESIAVQYEPPKAGARSMNAAEVGVMIDEKMDQRDLSGAIIGLASQGYLRMEEIESSKLFSSNDYRLIRLKPPDDRLSRFEHDLMNALFEGTDAEVRLSAMSGNFYVHLVSLRETLYDDLTGQKLFTRNPLKVRASYSRFGLVVGIVGAILATFTATGLPLVGWLSAAAAGLIIIAFGWIMPARTRQGVHVRQSIRGFQEFMMRADKDRLERMGADLFYKYLPYAVALHVTDQWAEAFSGLSLQPPNWYVPMHSYSTFNTAVFASQIGNSTARIGHAVFAAPRGSGLSGGGSGGGGGGFSGGGGGGGGGGSW